MQMKQDRYKRKILWFFVKGGLIGLGNVVVKEKMLEEISSTKMMHQRQREMVLNGVCQNL